MPDSGSLAQRPGRWPEEKGRETQQKGRLSVATWKEQGTLSLQKLKEERRSFHRRENSRTEQRDPTTGKLKGHTKKKSLNSSATG